MMRKLLPGTVVFVFSKFRRGFTCFTLPKASLLHIAFATLHRVRIQLSIGDAVKIVNLPKVGVGEAPKTSSPPQVGVRDVFFPRVTWKAMHEIRTSGTVSSSRTSTSNTRRTSMGLPPVPATTEKAGVYVIY